MSSGLFPLIPSSRSTTFYHFLSFFHCSSSSLPPCCSLNSTEPVGGIEACKLAQSARRVIWIPIFALQCAMKNSAVISTLFHYTPCGFHSFGLPSPPHTPSSPYSNYPLSFCISLLVPPIFLFTTSSHTFTFAFFAPFFATFSSYLSILYLSLLHHRLFPYTLFFSLALLSSFYASH